jgi:uncharacterized protein (DUF885 family)
VDPLKSMVGVEDDRLAVLLYDHWEWQMDLEPVWASRLGDRSRDARLGESGVEAEIGRRATRDRLLAHARAVPRAELSAADALNLDLLQASLEDDAALDACEFPQWSLSPRGNALTLLNDLPQVRPLRTPADGDALILRYRGFAAWVDGEIASLKAGIQAGRTPSRGTTEKVLAQLRAELALPLAERAAVSEVVIAEDVDVSVWSVPDQVAFSQQLGELVSGEVAHALERYADVIERELLPKSRDDAQPGLSGLPGGAACYSGLIRHYTSLDRTADELHQLGLSELARIHAELRQRGAELLGTDDLDGIHTRLRSDPALRFKTRDEVQAKAEAALAAANAATPKFFGRLPETPCVVRPVPEFEAPFTTVAYYQPPADDDSRPGQYYVNTYAPETRPSFEAAALAFHESVPGHHLQIAIAKELSELPAFRRHDGQTAFVEGWALYSERLAGEMGLYTDPLDQLGVLSFDAWRASRLVVDTGLHAKGWSRQQAIDFMLANTPLAENNIVNEVDRYISVPGQALAYKVGQLEILALRAEAEAALGERFDLPGFHDVVLGAGAVPLPVLRARVEAWVAERKAS